MVLSRREEKREENDVTAWNSRLTSLVDVQDFSDVGHLHEYFTKDERIRVIQELEQMPTGSRSLRKAISIVNPTILEEDPTNSNLA